MNDRIYPSMVIRSQVKVIDLLEKENKLLDKKLHELQQENKKLKERIRILTEHPFLSKLNKITIKDSDVDE